MAEFKVKTYNSISQAGLERFDSTFQVGEDVINPDALLLRSHDLHETGIEDSVMAVVRAGAGTNNIPTEKLTDRGVVVFNTPGVNANAVKELVFAGLLLGARRIHDAIDYVDTLDTDNLKASVEKGKKQYAGVELYGKTLAVIGLGAIGVKVANAASAGFGMRVVGYDPAISVNNALQLLPHIEKTERITDAVEDADFVTIHAPLLESTRGLISRELIEQMKEDVVLVNFARDALVDEQALVEFLERRFIHTYITDFPNPTIHGNPNVVELPHLGASTEEAEENCAIIAVDQLVDYLKNGNIRNSINFPEAQLANSGLTRITLSHANQKGVVANITKVLERAGLNISDMLNKHKNGTAYTILDVDEEVPAELSGALSKQPHIKRVRVIKK